ncbi:hypothetical protein ACFSTH_05655 [Paenibacillus yanchengensis]|uniref:Uncharacterized protein n=1 Tax=Paenibacillus yanchengensis TaxID=2035833 RepID=A0ABW4YHH3_9BACL
MDKEKNKFLAYFDLLTQSCLENLLSNDLDKVADKEYWDEIEGFIKDKKDIDYSYIYPRNEDDISYQVEHFAPMNEKQHKPVYIYVWSKLSKDWDIQSIENIVKILAKNFLHMNIEEVELLETPTYEETKVSYERDYEPYL